MLEDKRALEVAGAVQSRGQSKVTLEQGTDPPKAI
jgi:hypothetical protein